MVDKNMIIADVLDMDKDVARVFFSHGLFCVGCPSARGESIEEASLTHGLEVDTLIEDINNFFEKKGNN